MSLPIYHATGDKKKAFIYSALSGFAGPLGAFVGALILLPFIGDLTLAISFAVIAGIMVFISLDELLLQKLMIRLMIVYMDLSQEWQ